MILGQVSCMAVKKKLPSGKERTSTHGQLQVNYTKSRLFRVIHGDGVIGNITPKRHLFVSFYSERASLPDRVVHEITQDGRLGEPVEETNNSPGLMREMEVGVVLDIETAKAFAVWLTTMASRIDAMYAVEEAAEKKNAD